METKINTRHVTLHSMLELKKCKPVIWFKWYVTDSFNSQIKLPRNLERSLKGTLTQV